MSWRQRVYLAMLRSTCSRLTIGLLGCVVFVCACVPPVRALELTGVLLYKLNMDGRPGPFWHTSSDPGGRPLGINETGRVGTFDNQYEAEVDKELLPGSHIFTAFWQSLPGEWPLFGMVLNLYFNRDNLNPGISAIVPGVRAFTAFSVNTAPTTYSLYLREVQNNAGLSYEDGTWRARLGVAFYLPSGGITDRWRLSDLTDIDRVGVRDLRPDGAFDDLMIFELVVEPALVPTPGQASAPSRPLANPEFIAPLSAQVGADLWPAPPTSALPLTPAPVMSTPARETPSESAAGDFGESLTPAPTPETVVTGTPPASPHATDVVATQTAAAPTPGAAATPTRGAGATPADLQTRSTPARSRSAPPAGTPTPRAARQRGHGHAG